MTHELATIEKLDEEFKNSLKEIQPYLLKCSLKWTNNEMELCREWLYRLSKTDRRDISLRNAYLAKLLKQLQNGKLNEPFDRHPKDNETLLPLTTFLPMNFKVRCDESENTQIHTLVSDMLNFPMTVVVHKSAENHECSNECLKEVKKKEVYNDGLVLSNILNNSYDEQCQKKVLENNESGDGMLLNYETKLKSMEKMFEELKIKNEFLTNQAQLYADRNQLNNDQIMMVNAELNKVKKDLEQMSNRLDANESGNLNDFKTIVDNTTELDNRIGFLLSEIQNLKTMVEDNCENKKIMNDMMEYLDDMNERHNVQLTENKNHFHEQITRLQNTISQLEENANSRAEEIDALEEIIDNQRRCLEIYEKSLKHFEDYFTEKTPNPY